MVKEITVKNIIWFLMLLCFGYAWSQPPPAELFDSPMVETNGESTAWSITSTGDDTSKIIHAFSEMGLQYFFEDTAGTHNDSVAYKIEVLASNAIPDSSFQLVQTLVSSETTGGYRPIKTINIPPARYIKLVVTGLTGNTQKASLRGWMYLCKWSNQPGMDNKLR